VDPSVLWRRVTALLSIPAATIVLLFILALIALTLRPERHPGSGQGVVVLVEVVAAIAHTAGASVA